MYNLEDYDPVEKRLGYKQDAKSFWEDYPQGRISTEMEVCADGQFIVKAYGYRNSEDVVAFSTGYAEERVTSHGPTATSALEVCETSAIGRMLANAGYAAKGKRPSQSEMKKVVAAKQPKPPVQEVKADDQDYWTTPVGQYNKVVDAPVTLEKAMENIAAVMGTPEAVEAPSCEHGHMRFKEGEKNGKAWGGYFCDSAVSTAHRCPTRWYTLGSDGKWQPQKAWA